MYIRKENDRYEVYMTVNSDFETVYEGIKKTLISKEVI
jgi:hypothetical protein